MPPMPPTRGSLLLRLREPDDRAAWAEFVRVYGPALYGYFRRRNLQEADAVDLTQDVFAELSRRLGSFGYDPDRGRFRAWLFRLARWRLLKFARARKRDKIAAAGPAVDVPAREEDGAAFRDAVRMRLVEVALDEVRPTVSATTFEAFRRVALAHEAPEAVAESLGISRAAVYLGKVRMLAKLREAVARLDADEEELG